MSYSPAKSSDSCQPALASQQQRLQKQSVSSNYNYNNVSSSSSKLRLENIVLRPVTTRFPSSAAVWQNTNLPLACVITPLAAPPLLQPPQPQQQQLIRQRRETTTSSTATSAPFTAGEPPLPLAAVPIFAKCLHCGAPHPVQSVGLTHSLRRLSPNTFLLCCYLCGKTCSAAWEDQLAARLSVEHYLTSMCYELKFENKTDNNNNNTATALWGRMNNSSSNSDGKSGYYCGDYVIPLSRQQQQQDNKPMTMSATSCPPLWIVILDGTCPHRAYWQRVANLLRRILLEHNNINNNSTNSTTTGLNTNHCSNLPPPPGLQFALISAQADCTWSIWDLQSPVPHVLQYPLPGDDVTNNNSNTSSSSSSIAASTAMCPNLFVPVDAMHSSHIDTALRALADTTGPLLTAQLYNNGRHRRRGSSLSATLTALLTWLGQQQPPIILAGALNDNGPNNNIRGNTTTTSATPPRLYAGGKITCFLSSAPEEIMGGGTSSSSPLQQHPQNDTDNTTGTHHHHHVGRGGWGGSCATAAAAATFGLEQLRLFEPPSPSTEETNTAAAIPDRHDSHFDPEMGNASTFRAVGDSALNNNNKTAFLSHGQDEVTPAALAQQYPHCHHINVPSMYAELGAQCARAGLGIDLLLLLLDDDDHNLPSGNFGLPFLRILSETSGAPGPLIFTLYDDDDSGAHRLEREVMARVPWGDQVVLGAELRLRLSPGWKVDTTFAMDMSLSQADRLALAPRYTRSGLMGPASVDETSPNLWHVGSCDPFTSFTVDLEINRKHKQHTHWSVAGFGEVTVQPLLQMCFAYNTVRQDAANSGNYVTERRLRVACRCMPVASQVETLFSSIDVEALAVVLFHKLTLASLQDGLMETWEIAQSWLKSLLICVYRSAELQDARLRFHIEYGLDKANSSDDNDDNADDDATDAVAHDFFPNERLLDREGELSATDVLLAQGHERLRLIPSILYGLLQCDALRPSSKTFRPTLDARCAASAQMTSMTPSVLYRCVQPRLDLWSTSQEAHVIAADLNLEWRSLLAILRDQECESGAASEEETDHLLLILECPYRVAVFNAKPLINNSPSIMMSHQPPVYMHNAMLDALKKYRVPPTLEFKLDCALTNDLRSLLTDVLVNDAPTATGLNNFAEWKAEMGAIVHE